MQTYQPPFDKSREKNIYFSTYTLPNCFAICVYAWFSTTARVYQDLCQKIQNEVGFPYHDRRSLIFGLPYTRNILTQPFSCILEAIRAQFRAMEKGEWKNSTLRAKLLWRNYFILSLHPFVPQVWTQCSALELFPYYWEDLITSFLRACLWWRIEVVETQFKGTRFLGFETCRHGSL